MKRILRLIFLSWCTFASPAGGAYAYTLRVTSCTDEHSGTPDEEISFQFCKGGSYCDTEEFVVDLPSGISVSDGETIEIPVAPGYEPTTIDIIKGSGEYDYDAW